MLEKVCLHVRLVGCGFDSASQILLYLFFYSFFFFFLRFTTIIINATAEVIILYMVHTNITIKHDYTLISSVQTTGLNRARKALALERKRTAQLAIAI